MGAVEGWEEVGGGVGVGGKCKTEKAQYDETERRGEGGGGS